MRARITVGAIAIATVTLCSPPASPAAGASRHASKVGLPRVATGSVSRVHGTSAELGGTINPNGSATTYYFQFGPTVAYTAQTLSGTLPSGRTNVKVGMTAAGFLPGYHYRLVATNAAGQTKFGRDRVFATQTTRLSFKITKSSAPVKLGGPVTVSGTLSGLGAANHKIFLQASPYPYLTAFLATGPPIVTNASGRFSFRVASLSKSTQFRVSTVDPRPVFSSVLTEHVAVKVTFKVRSAGHAGLVRLYGTVSPAQPGARVLFQLEKAVRPTVRSEKVEEKAEESGESNSVKFATQGSARVKAATRTVSRFSSVVAIRRKGRYRAFVVLPRSGPYVSGASPRITLRAAPASTLRALRRKH
jgi:hypothetical protein